MAKHMYYYSYVPVQACHLCVHVFLMKSMQQHACISSLFCQETLATQLTETLRSGGPGLPNMNPFASRPKSSLITLEQSILPGFIPPKPLDRVLKGS